MAFFRTFFIAALILTASATGFSQQVGSLTGTVQDVNGAVIVGATVTAIAAGGAEKTATTNQRGEFTISGLTAGKYTVKVFAPNFALYDNADVEVTPGRRTELIVPMTVEVVEEQVEVATDQGVSTDPENNAGATVLKEKDLEALPDDPDELEAALQALAGPSAGPNGGQIYIDGFTGGRLPPKEAIREIRINQNPFSAEYNRLGFGRIEILTRPGSDKWRGSANFNFNDARLNSRNPFALNRAPGQTKTYGGNISGPIQKGKSSFFLDINNRDVDTNTVINAIVLDQNLNEIPFQQEVQVPTRRFSFSPRFDYQINNNNTLVARYSYNRGTSKNQGIGGLTLPSRAYDSTNSNHEFRLTETMIINPTTINETRFEYEIEDRSQTGDNSIPSISAGAAFVGGGATIGNSYNKNRGWELQNYTTTTLGKNSLHSIKFGMQLNGNTITDRSENGFGGSFSFINIDSYRDAILDSDIPTQYSVTVGNPEQKVSQTQVGLFFTDDWRVNPGLTLSFGLRYENQTNISDNLNFAPRFSFAWSPGAGGARAPKTVFRGGLGLFYDRFSQNLTLNALRFNGVEQLRLDVSANDPEEARRNAAIALLDQVVFNADGSVSNIPSVAQILAALPQSNTIQTVADDLKSPYMFQAAFGVERQLPFNTTVSAFYIGARTWNVLRSRNINAPVCPEQIDCEGAPRPFEDDGNINQYESTGRSDQQQFIINFRSNFRQGFSLFGNYRLGYAKGDSDGAGTFPAYSYDLSEEYGRSSFDIRHNIIVGGNFNLPYGISLNPFVIFNSGRPFNIIRGIDSNGDLRFTERPTFGELAAKCELLGLSNSFCDVTGHDPNEIIPRNFGQGPKYFSVNLRVGKNFGFGGSGESTQTAGGTGGDRRRAGGGLPGGGRGPGGGGPGGGGRMVMIGGPGGGGDGRKPYNLNVSVSFNNLFNNVNFNTPVGNLASSRFGQFTSTSGGFGGFGGGGGGGSSANRRIDLQVRFSW